MSEQPYDDLMPEDIDTPPDDEELPQDPDWEPDGDVLAGSSWDDEDFEEEDDA